MSEIKFVATDVDGTLVPESSPKIYPEIFDEINRLTDKGIKVCIASGRQYESVAKMFEPVKDKLIFIAENGAYVRTAANEINTIWMDRAQSEEIITQLRQFEELEIVASSPTMGSIMESKNEAFIDLIFNSYKNKGMVVEDILKADIPFVKIATYKKGSIKAEGEILVPQWENLCKCCLAGKEWVDFMDAKVDKGNALSLLMDKFSLKPEEVMAFGDNDNDCGMLKAAGHSYAVEGARDSVKASAKYICKGYDKRGVLEVLKTL